MKSWPLLYLLKKTSETVQSTSDKMINRIEVEARGDIRAALNEPRRVQETAPDLRATEKQDTSIRALPGYTHG